MSDPRTWQMEDKPARPNIGTVAEEGLENLLAVLDSDVGEPLKVSLSGTVLTIGPSETTRLESDGANGTQTMFKKRIAPINNVNVATVLSTLDIVDGDTTGDFSADPDLGTAVGASKFIIMGIEVRGDGKIHVVWGAEGASAPLAGLPVFTVGSERRLMFVLENDGTPGAWNFLTPLKSNLSILPLSSPISSAPAGGSVDDYTLIVGAAAEYATLALALSAVAARQRILVTEDQVLAAQVDFTKAFPYEIIFLNGAKLTCASVFGTSVAKIGSDLYARNLSIECTHTTGITPSAIEYNGDNSYLDNAQVKMNGAGGTITNAFIINAGKKGNYGRGLVWEADGSITKAIKDNALQPSNSVLTRDRT